MSGCLDHCRAPECEWLNLGERRNMISSVVAGAMFFIGWWIMIDALALYPDHSQLHPACVVCGIVGTLALFMVNSVSNGQVRGEMYTDDGCMGQTGARVWLFFGFLLGFGALIASSWILFGLYVVHNDDNKPNWAGIAVFLQNALIFFGSLVFKFGRTEDLWG